MKKFNFLISSLLEFCNLSEKNKKIVSQELYDLCLKLYKKPLMFEHINNFLTLSSKYNEIINNRIIIENQINKINYVFNSYNKNICKQIITKINKKYNFKIK